MMQALLACLHQLVMALTMRHVFPWHLSTAVEHAMSRAGLVVQLRACGFQGLLHCDNSLQEVLATLYL